MSYESDDHNERVREFNNLVSQFTKENLKSVADALCLDDLTKILVASFLYLKAPWNTKFDPSKTGTGIVYCGIHPLSRKEFAVKIIIQSFKL